MAGFDCSGTPNLTGDDGKHDPYTLCVVALPAEDKRMTTLRNNLALVRFRYHMSAGQEFHAHNMSEEMRADVLEVALAQDLIVGALLIDKAATREKWGAVAFPSPAGFQVLAARAALEPFLRRYCLTRLFCDEDVRGRERQKRLTTEVLQIHRETWPNTKLKVRFIGSEQEPLIQVADVMAYGLACEVRGSIRAARLKRLVEGVREDLRNIVIGPVSLGDGRRVKLAGERGRPAALSLARPEGRVLLSVHSAI